ncbi:MAG: hypothetical protein KGH71_00955 [Candidatus Micrarchaeota archaeon]|nr:hypothetical protein [Candidatus Micrarchaeota archaeon]
MEKSEVIFLNSVFFVLGFTFVFALVGILLQTLLSNVALEAIAKNFRIYTFTFG